MHSLPRYALLVQQTANYHSQSAQLSFQVELTNYEDLLENGLTTSNDHAVILVVADAANRVLFKVLIRQRSYSSSYLLFAVIKDVLLLSLRYLLRLVRFSYRIYGGFLCFWNIWFWTSSYEFSWDSFRIFGVDGNLYHSYRISSNTMEPDRIHSRTTIHMHDEDSSRTPKKTFDLWHPNHILSVSNDSIDLYRDRDILTSYGMNFNLKVNRAAEGDDLHFHIISESWGNSSSMWFALPFTSRFRYLTSWTGFGVRLHSFLQRESSAQQIDSGRFHRVGETKEDRSTQTGFTGRSIFPQWYGNDRYFKMVICITGSFQGLWSILRRCCCEDWKRRAATGTKPNWQNSWQITVSLLFSLI